METKQGLISYEENYIIRDGMNSVRSLIMLCVFTAFPVVNFIYMPQIIWFYWPLVLFFVFTLYRVSRTLILIGSFGDGPQQKIKLKLERRAEKMFKEREAIRKTYRK